MSEKEFVHTHCISKDDLSSTLCGKDVAYARNLYPPGDTVVLCSTCIDLYYERVNNRDKVCVD